MFFEPWLREETPSSPRKKRPGSSGQPRKICECRLYNYSHHLPNSVSTIMIHANLALSAIAIWRRSILSRDDRAERSRRP